MSVKNYPSDWICDICHDKITSPTRPDKFRSVSFQVRSSGFEYASCFDVCEKCVPSDYFSDPMSRKKLPDNIIKSIFKRIFSPQRSAAKGEE